MRKTIIALAAVTALTACLDSSTTSVDDVARNSAKTVVNGIVASRYPGVDASVVTDCVIDNASATEIFQIAQAAVVGTSPATTSLVVEIAQRPDTVSCIAENTLGLGDAGLGLGDLLSAL